MGETENEGGDDEGDCEMIPEAMNDEGFRSIWAEERYR